MSDSSLHEPIRPLAAIAAAGATIFVLVEARDVLIPFVIALGAWLIINVVADRVGRVRIGGRTLPGFVRTLVALLLIGGVVAVAVVFVSASVAGVAADADIYGQRLNEAVAALDNALGISVTAALQEAIAEIDVRATTALVVNAVTDLARTLGAVIIYTIFLFLEQQVFPLKIAALGRTEEARRAISVMLSRVRQGVADYLAAKTLIALIMGIGSYLILSIAGVPHAAFFAFVIFLLDYIPTFGSLAAVIIATIAALAAFPNPEPALVTGGVLAALQIIMGNLVEPRLMSNSLNLSPLAVIISLSVWGLIWGLMGLFLAVPLTAATAIILAGFAQTRPLAILLSHDGRLGEERS